MDFFSWEHIKENYKGPVLTLIGWFLIVSLILATFGWGFLLPIVGWMFVGGIVGLLFYVTYVTIHDTIFDINARR